MVFHRFTSSQRLWYAKTWRQCVLYHKYFLCFVQKSPVLSVCMSLPRSQLFMSSAAVSALGTNRFGHAGEWHGLFLSVSQARTVEVSPFSAWALFSVVSLIFPGRLLKCANEPPNNKTAPMVACFLVQKLLLVADPGTTHWRHLRSFAVQFACPHPECISSLLF